MTGRDDELRVERRFDADAGYRDAVREILEIERSGRPEELGFYAAHRGEYWFAVTAVGAVVALFVGGMFVVLGDGRGSIPPALWVPFGVLGAIVLGLAAMFWFLRPSAPVREAAPAVRIRVADDQLETATGDGPFERTCALAAIRCAVVKGSAGGYYVELELDDDARVVLVDRIEERESASTVAREIERAAR